MTRCGFAQKVKNSGRNGIRTGSGNDRVSFGGRLRKRKTPSVILLCSGYPVATAPGSDIQSDEARFVQTPSLILQSQRLYISQVDPAIREFDSLEIIVQRLLRLLFRWPVLSHLFER